MSATGTETQGHAGKLTTACRRLATFLFEAAVIAGFTVTVLWGLPLICAGLGVGQ